MRAQESHGMTESSEYRSWTCMKHRCENKHADGYWRYGGRGISVCARWSKSFIAFLSDMGPKPTPQHTIERKDNKLGYNPSNCRWATKKEQLRNTTVSFFITLNGVKKSVHDWADETGIKYQTLKNRILKGWSVEKTLTLKPYECWNKDITTPTTKEGGEKV